MELLELLEKRRTERGLNDAQFARLLGIGTDFWSLTKTGKRAIRYTMLSRIVRAFPEDREVHGAVLAFIAGETAAAVA